MEIGPSLDSWVVEDAGTIGSWSEERPHSLRPSWFYVKERLDELVPIARRKDVFRPD